MLVTRRGILGGGLGILATGAARAAERPIVNDASGLDPTEVAHIVRPRASAEVARLVKDWQGTISIGGGGFSMGGQIAEPDSLHFDMRGLNRLLALDPVNRRVRVQTGMRWRDLQSLIDPHGLSVKIMQSYSDFTIGGALSVNCHGRYVAAGPIINSVRDITLVTAAGDTISASRTERPELFHAAIGGYGGLGIITEATLDLVANVRMERRAASLPLSRYPAFFDEHVRGDAEAVMHNADIDPADFSRAMAVSWYRTDKPVTIPDRLFPAGASSAWDRTSVWLLSSAPGAHLLRREVVDPLDYAQHPVVWRNHEASLSLGALGPLSDATGCFALQEYFVPRVRFLDFARAMSRILIAGRVNALNVSIRHSPADPQTLLAWARQEVFSFVLFYRQGRSPAAQAGVRQWTRQLIDAVLECGGSYYLPYQLHATPEQFNRAYPGAQRFWEVRRALDPRGRFRNRLWDRYGA
ncbi:MAG TPA: FAD-binding oxidoreductase [Rhizomicrobium sp.]|nr:FAD-binding oxidoreductase [Rhizomicrobium sp.]